MDMTKILERVRKLLAIANDHRANPNEAAAAAGQAENIMRKFNIEHADVLLKAARAGEGEFDKANVSAFMKRDVDNGHRAKRSPKWAGWLAIRVAKLNDSEVRITDDPERGAAIQFCGFKSDVQVAAWMFDYLVSCMVGDVRAWQRAATRTKVESNSYREGFVMALCAKLKELERGRDAEMASAGASAGALVVAKQGAIAKHFGNFKYRNTTSHARTNTSARDAGYAAGQRVDVARRAVGGTAAPGQLRIGG